MEQCSTKNIINIKITIKMNEKQQNKQGMVNRIDKYISIYYKIILLSKP